MDKQLPGPGLGTTIPFRSVAGQSLLLPVGLPAKPTPAPGLTPAPSCLSLLPMVHPSASPAQSSMDQGRARETCPPSLPAHQPPPQAATHCSVSLGFTPSSLFQAQLQQSRVRTSLPVMHTGISLVPRLVGTGGPDALWLCEPQTALENSHGLSHCQHRKPIHSLSFFLDHTPA